MDMSETANVTFGGPVTVKMPAITNKIFFFVSSENSPSDSPFIAPELHEPDH